MNILRTSIILLAVVCLAQTVFGVEPVKNQSTPAVQTLNLPQLRIMSFNVRRKGKEAQSVNKWKNRRVKVVTAIKTVRPDILGLQESTIDQIQDIQALLKNKEYAWVGAGRGAQWFNRAANEFNPIFYNKARLELLESDTFVINPSGINFLFKPKKIGLLRRICTWGKFKDKKTNKVFFIYNTHLDNKYQEARINSIRNIMKIVETKKMKQPVIFMGDFNMPLTSDILKNELASFINTKDVARAKAGPDETRTGWDYQELKKIDHILVSKNAPAIVVRHAVLKESNKQNMASDHRPVMVDVILK